LQMTKTHFRASCFRLRSSATSCTATSNYLSIWKPQTPPQRKPRFSRKGAGWWNIQRNSMPATAAVQRLAKYCYRFSRLVNAAAKACFFTNIINDRVSL